MNKTNKGKAKKCDREENYYVFEVRYVDGTVVNIGERGTSKNSALKTLRDTDSGIKSTKYLGMVSEDDISYSK